MAEFLGRDRSEVLSGWVEYTRAGKESSDGPTHHEHFQPDDDFEMPHLTPLERETLCALDNHWASLEQTALVKASLRRYAGALASLKRKGLADSRSADLGPRPAQYAATPEGLYVAEVLRRG